MALLLPSELSSGEKQGLNSILDSKGMVDVSLKDKKGNATLNDASNALGASAHLAPAHPLVNPTKHVGLYSSPVSIFRTSSGVLASGASSAVSSS